MYRERRIHIFFFTFRQLWQLVKQVEETPADQRQPPVGLLTTECRTTWGPVSIKLY